MFSSELPLMDWRERVQVELNDLNKRMENLFPIVFYPAEQHINSISETQRRLMSEQYRVMQQYKEILELRLREG